MGAFTDLKITEQELADHGMTSLSGTKWTNQAEMLKAKLDEDGTFVGDRLNQVLELLESINAAASIGTKPFKHYLSNKLQALLEEIEAYLQQQVDDIQAGAVPSGSITTDKIRDGAITTSKVENGAITADKISETVIPSDIGAVSLDDLLTEASKSLLRDLNIMLNLSLGTSNIDAWADLLSDTSKINTGVSTGYLVSGGVLTSYANTNVKATGTTNDSDDVGAYASSVARFQSFIADYSNISSVAFKITKVGSPTDGLYVQIYSVSTNVPVSLLYTSDTVNASSISGTQDKTFNFTNVNLTVGNKYAFVIRRTGAVDSNNFCMVSRFSTNIYSNGTNGWYDGSVWNAAATDYYFISYATGTAQVVWKPVTATEVFSKMAIAAEQTLGTGTITFYVSDDGTEWAQITALNTGQDVTFNDTSINLKCIITGNASLSSVAWGGY